MIVKEGKRKALDPNTDKGGDIEHMLPVVKNVAAMAFIGRSPPIVAVSPTLIKPPSWV